MDRSGRFLAPSLAVVSTAVILFAGSVFGATSAGAAAAKHGFGAHLLAPGLAPRANARPSSLAALSVLPASVDLRRWAVTPGDQGQLNSCVPWTIDYSMLGWYSKYTGRVGQPFAPMYTYSQVNGGDDNGTTATATFDVAVKQGNDTRADYTQGNSNWKTRPTTAERTNAARFKIKGYTTLFTGTERVGSATLLKQALATNHPVAIEISVRSGFYYLPTSANTVDNDITTTVLGLHEVLVVGYDAAGLIVQNSWGTGWGDGGFGRISWRVVQADVGEAQIVSGFAQAATAPSVSAPETGFRAATVSKATKAKYTISWKGTAGNTGAITRYYVSYQVNGGAWVPVKLATLKSTSFVLNAMVDHRYRIAVRAAAGTKLGTIHYGASFIA